MRVALCIIGWFALAYQSWAQGVRRSAVDHPADVAVVVYNENDPLSRELADFYAGKRGIPAVRVVGLKCSSDEEISREEYDDQIAGPLRRIFDEHGWWERTPDQPRRGAIQHRDEQPGLFPGAHARRSPAHQANERLRGRFLQPALADQRRQRRVRRLGTRRARPVHPGDLGNRTQSLLPVLQPLRGSAPSARHDARGTAGRADRVDGQAHD